MAEIFFDGLCEPNPNGIATYGYVVVRNRKQIHENNGVIRDGKGMTNNVAEYSALLKAIEWVNSAENIPIDEDIVVKGDSRLVIKQMSGSWKIKSATSKKYVPMIMGFLKQRKGKIRFQWIPREENAEADRLSRIAYRNYTVRSKKGKY